MGCSSHISLVGTSLCQYVVWEALPELCTIATLDVYSGGVNSLIRVCIYNAGFGNTTQSTEQRPAHEDNQNKRSLLP